MVEVLCGSVKGSKIIGVIDQNDEGGRIPRNQWDLVRRDLARVALKVLVENPGCHHHP